MKETENVRGITTGNFLIRSKITVRFIGPISVGRNEYVHSVGMNYWNMHRRLASAFNTPRYNFYRIIFAPAWNFTRACKKFTPVHSRILDKLKWCFFNFFIFHLFFSLCITPFRFVFTSTNFEICTATLPPYRQGNSVVRFKRNFYFSHTRIFEFRAWQSIVRAIFSANGG